MKKMKGYRSRMMGTLRHALQAAGAFLVAQDYLPAADWDQIVGGIMVAAPFIWSWLDPAKKLGQGDI